MSKKLFLICLIGLIFVSSANAACEGGSQITTASGTFCRSNVTMNWWSASAWCKENGLHLATMYEMCPSWDGTEGNNKCPELNGVDSAIVWSATASGENNAFTIELSKGYVDTDYYAGGNHRQYDFNAFCK